MKVIYTGRNADITDAEKKKAQRKFDKVHRILSPSRSLDANVVFSRTRHTFDAEVTVRALSHTLVVAGSGMTPFLALSQALDKLEKQAVRNKHKLVDTRRHHRQRGEMPATVAAAIPPAEPMPQEEPAGPDVVRANGASGKPLTFEEARLALEESNRDQVTYRDADSGTICVLLRRRDGRLELVEAAG